MCCPPAFRINQILSSGVEIYWRGSFWSFRCASLTDENSTITLSGEYVLDEDLVLEWPNESVKSITINGGEGLSITGEGKLCFKYPESDPNGDNLTILLGGTAWTYFSNIEIG